MDYSTLQERARVSLARRIDVLRSDVDAWTALARTNAMGLASTQRAALVAMMSVLVDRQRAAFAAVDQPLAAAGFANGYATLIVEMTGAQELWRVFRTILAQLEDPALKVAVQAAGRVAADSYATGIRRARALGAIEPDRLREYPMVYLEAVDSPATAGRRDQAQALSTSIRQWRNLKLPLPIVLLPIDYLRSFPGCCAIHHEVGHNLDQDLALLAELRAALPTVASQETEKHWRRWSGEVLADALGVVLGGAGFGLWLGSLALLLGPADAYRDLDPDAVHPPLLIRVRLIAELLRISGVAGHLGYADQLTALSAEAPGQPWMAKFLAETPALANLVFSHQFAVLKNAGLRDLNSKLAADHDLVEKLAAFLLGAGPRPVPDAAHGMSPRLVPAAAQLAAWTAPKLDAPTLEAIEQGAIGYLEVIPEIATLAALQVLPGRRAFLEDLVRTIDFATVGRREPE